MMKKIINFLRKIGVLQVGSGDYMAGEFDDKKDLKKGDAEDNEINTLKKGTPSTLLFKIFVGISILFLLFVLVMLEFSIWFFVILIVWVWFIFHTKTAVYEGTLVIKKFFITFFAVFVISLILVVFTIQTDSAIENNTADNPNSLCKANNLDTEIKEHITVRIAENIGSKDIVKDNYTWEELKDLSYGFNIINGKEEYILAELCDDKNTLEPIDLVQEEWNFYNDFGGGNVTQFVNVNYDGSPHYAIEDPGIYQIYVYSSTSGSEWTIASKVNLEIK